MKVNFITLGTSTTPLPLVNDLYPVMGDNIQNEIMDYCKKFGYEVKNASLDDLKAEGLFNEQQLYLIDGFLIYIGEVKQIEENKATIELVKYKSGLGAVFYTYELTYVNNSWTFEIVGMAIS